MANTNHTKPNEKKWELRSAKTVSDKEILEISEKLSISPLTALLVYNRGQDTPEKAKKFIFSASGDYYDPFLMPDMDKAAKRILAAVQSKEKTVIYGDYDVDGVTSVSILYMYLSELGLTPEYYIPSRSTEGYGVNNDAIKSFADRNITLMITVDTGVTALDEVAYASGLGIDTVITDHHECLAELPKALAVVNPRREDSLYPFCELAGVGVVFKLLCALEMKRTGNITNVKKYIDLVSIGTIADVMPLTDENRLLVSEGLEMLNRSPRMGIASLIAAASQGDKKTSKAAQKITSSVISFTVAPRINAAGRIESAEKAVKLFLCHDPEEAKIMAEELCEINRRRQAEENRIIDEAAEKIRESFDFENDKVIVLSEENWHHGVIGIVASRITERFGLPSILISFDSAGVGKGSGRSVKGINLVEALTYCSDLLIKYGGHELAAGLTVSRENFEGFRQRINSFVRENMTDFTAFATVEGDTYIEPSDVTLEQAQELFCLEPYGVANPSPLFFTEGLIVRDIISLAEKHTKLILERDGVRLTALYFGHSRPSLDIYRGDNVDIAFTVGINEFRGNVDVQVIVRDLRRRTDDKKQTVTDEDKAKYAEILAGGTYSRNDDILPSRDDFAKVYLYLKRRPGQYRDDCLGMREIINSLGGKLSYCKLKVILTVLDETGLVSIKFSEECDENFHFGVNYVKNKIDIEKSPFYVKIRSAAVKE